MGWFGPPHGSSNKKAGSKNVNQNRKLTGQRGMGGKGGRVVRGAVGQPKLPEFGDAESPHDKKANLLERDASRAVTYRESLLLQLNSIVLHWPGETVSRRESRQTTDAVRILTNLSKQLGEAGLKCVEKIVAWVLVVSDSSGPKSFLWNGSDYLVKMFTDLDFVPRQLGQKAWSMGNFCEGNPLLLSSEEMAGRGPHGKAHATRVRAASMVLLDVLKRQGAASPIELSIPRTDLTAPSTSRHSAGNTSPRMKSQERSRENFKSNKRDKILVVTQPTKRDKPREQKAHRSVGPAQTKEGPTTKKRPVRRESKEAVATDDVKVVKKNEVRESKEADAADDGKAVKKTEVRESKEAVATGDGKAVKKNEVRESKEANAADDGKAVKKTEVRESKEAVATGDVKVVKKTEVRESKEADAADDSKAVKKTEVRESKEAVATGDGKAVKKTEVRESKEADAADDGKAVKKTEVRESKADAADDGKAVKKTEVRESKEADAADNGMAVKKTEVRESKEADAADDGKAAKKDEADDYEDEEYEDEEYEDEEMEECEAVQVSKVSESAWLAVRVLGEGNYGTVNEVVRGGTVRGAMKVFKQDHEDDEETAEYALRTQTREIELAQLLEHPNIVKVLDWSGAGPSPFLVFELMPMNLLELIQQHTTGMTYAVVKAMSRQLCAAIAYCHHMSVVHRDLKPENVLVRIQGDTHTLKLCDFGASRRLDVCTASRNQMDELDDMTNYVGSRWYRAPESLANRTTYRFEIDVWGVACIVAEMASGQNLFGGDEEVEVLESIMSLIGSPPTVEANQFIAHDMVVPPMPIRRSFTTPVDHMRGLGHQGIALLTSMLQWSPQNRPSMRSCLDHPYLNDDAPAPPLPSSPNPSSISSGEIIVHNDEDSVESFDATTINEDAEKEAPFLENKIDEIWRGSGSIGSLLKEIMSGDSSHVVAELSAFLEDHQEAKMFSENITLLINNLKRENSLEPSALFTHLCRALNLVIESKISKHVDWCELWLSSQHRSSVSLISSLAEAFEIDQPQCSPRATTRTEYCLNVCGATLDRLFEQLPDLSKEVENQSLNRLIGVLSPILLDSEESSVKLASLNHLEEVLFGVSLTGHRSLLSATSKSILLQVKLLGNAPLRRLAVTTDRTSAFTSIISSLQKAYPSRQYATTTDSPALIALCPYYKSQYGKKRSEGFAVEEGEGLGPRKELFTLVAAQLQAQWIPCGHMVVSFKLGMATVYVVSAEVDGRALSRREVQESLVGHRISMDSREDDHRVLTSVARNEGPGTTLRIDRAMTEDADRRRVILYKKNSPIFVYQQGGEALWLNPNLPQGPRSEEYLFYSGLLMGLTAVNSCFLPMKLSAVFFRALLDERWSPQLSDLLELDPTLQTTISRVKEMQQDQFTQFIETEFEPIPPSPLTRGCLLDRQHAYINSFVNDFFEAAVAWQLKCIRHGFSSALPSSGMSALDLKKVVCGEMEDTSADFDFRTVFRLKLDKDFSSCEPLQSTFWEVVNSMSVSQKRKLLLFITGVDRLPSPKSELLTIDVPFFPMGLADHRKVLGMIPQSHTCDNVLELPNYWKSIEKLDNGSSLRASLLLKLRDILSQKLNLACENASGYGLDGLETDGNEGDSDEDIPLTVHEENESSQEGEDSFGESSGDMNIPGLDEEGSIPSVNVPRSPTEEGENMVEDGEEVDLYNDDDYEDEFEFDEESTEL